MSYINRVTVKDDKGYREELWNFNDYDDMEATLDDQLAEGTILDWWIAN